MSEFQNNPVVRFEDYNIVNFVQKGGWGTVYSAGKTASILLMPYINSPQ